MKLSLLPILFLFTLPLFSQYQFLINDRQGYLYTYDPDSCTTSYVGLVGMYDIAICPNGEIYSNNFSVIYHFNQVSQQNTQITDIFPSGINALLALDNDYLLTFSESSLYRVSIQDGSNIVIGTMPGSTSAGDLVYLNGYFYLTSETNELWRFRLSEDYSALLEYSVVGILDSPFQRMYGVMKTGAFIKGTGGCNPIEDIDTQRLIGFEDRNAYEIDVNTAHCTLICEDLPIDSINGAASIATQEIISPVPPAPIGLNVELPNIFTPNNDGINDFFQPTSFSVIDLFEITIFNRWGNVVYSSENSLAGWDGTTANGEKAIEGVYFYRCRYIRHCPDEEKEQQGYLELVR